jgi:transcriptional regulator NrdR family protein
MQCSRCGNITNLKQSWAMEITVRRFRECPKCKNKFFTYEIPEQNIKNAQAFIDQANRG